jgi:hypothetical protein
VVQREEAGLPHLDRHSLIGDGGFGRLYLDPRDGSKCIKVLKTPLAGSACEHFAAVVDALHSARPSSRAVFLTRFAWPIEMFLENDRLVAYTMPLAPPECYFDLTAAGRTTRQSLQLKFISDSAYWRGSAIASLKPAVSPADLIEVLIDAFDSLSTLHAEGLTFGDVSSNNLVARLSRPRPGIFFFDADSIAPQHVRDATPLVSAGFETPEGLNAFEIDRARFAIVVLRLLLEQPAVRPVASAALLASAGYGPGATALGPPVDECFRAGSEPAFQDLGASLRALRSGDMHRVAVDDAVASGLARRVVRELSVSGIPIDENLARQASAQLAFEDRCESASGAERRRLIRRHSYLRGGWQLDIPHGGLGPPPSTVEQLRTLIFDGFFDELSTHLVLTGLGALESDSLLERAVQHMIAETSIAPARFEVSAGEATMRFAWPMMRSINVVKIVVSGPGVLSEHWVERGESEVVRRIAAQRGAQLKVSITPGTRGPSGRTVVGVDPIESDVVIPPSLPTVTTTNRRFQGTGVAVGGGVTVPAVVVLDSAQILALQLAEDRLRRRRRRRRAATVTCVLIVLMGTALGLRRYLSSPESDPLQMVAGNGFCVVDLPPETAAERVSLWTIDSGGVRREVRQRRIPRDNRLRLVCPRYDKTPVLEMQRQSGGEPVGELLVAPSASLSSLAVAVAPDGLLTVSSLRPLTGSKIDIRMRSVLDPSGEWSEGTVGSLTPALAVAPGAAVEVQARTGSDPWWHLGWYQLTLNPSESSLTGLGTTPIVETQGEVVRFSWEPSPTRAVDRYRYRYSTLDRVWLYGRTATTTQQLRAPETRDLSFEVRAEFRDGGLGPWVAAPLVLSRQEVNQP